ncbi:hypothetical protein [uncultured Draconibacterium sp.]|uniref:hypothetical protein n=1 Tax=uncultured Draconibacterium sp. TaxID=1573823 RepID=UPI0029C647FA|nr:hypothetical protein [uncultured Draconibacterium sp.]
MKNQRGYFFDKIPAYRLAGLLSFNRLQKKEPVWLEDKSTKNIPLFVHLIGFQAHDLMIVYDFDPNNLE